MTLDEALAPALAGDPRALHVLAVRLVPVVRGRVAIALRRWKRDAPEAAIDDFAQEAFAAIFADGARPLRRFDPSRGTSLEGFVAMLVEHKVASILRSARRNPWSETPTDPEAMERACEPASVQPRAEAIVATRDALARVMDALRRELTPQGLAMFEALYVDALAVDEVCASMNLSADAVYAWRSRLAKRVRSIAERVAMAA